MISKLFRRSKKYSRKSQTPPGCEPESPGPKTSMPLILTYSTTVAALDHLLDPFSQQLIPDEKKKNGKKNAKKVPLRFMISIFFCSNAFFSCLFGSIIQGVYLHAYTGHLYNNFYNDGNEKHSNNTHFFFFVRQTNSRIILYLLIQKNINTSSIKFVKNKYLRTENSIS